MGYIRFENIVKNFGSTQVLKNINLDIEKGQLVTLLGPSGCGKSTLLRCLAGLETVTSGKIWLDGKEITNVEPRKRDIGMVFQQYSLFPNLTVEKNVAFGLQLKKMSKNQIDTKVKEMLEIVGLGDKGKNYPSQLSGGQQQRAALARAIVTEPKVLLLDEPLSAIDALLRKSLQMEIRRIQRETDITAIFVTHDQNEAMVMSDMIHLLYDGKIEQSAEPAQMYITPMYLVQSRLAESQPRKQHIHTCWHGEPRHLFHCCLMEVSCCGSASGSAQGRCSRPPCYGCLRESFWLQSASAAEFFSRYSPQKSSPKQIGTDVNSCWWQSPVSCWDDASPH